MSNATMISNTVGYAVFIGLFVIIFGLYGAKSWLHKKCKSLLIEHNQEHDIDNQHISQGALTGATAIQPPQPPKSQQYFTSQILPQSTTQLQIYLSTIDHRIAAIRTPLVQVAITILLYTYSNSELVTNYNANNYVYNIVFHSFQLLALITFYFVSNLDPGIIKPHPAPRDGKHEKAAEYETIGDTPSDYIQYGASGSYQNEETEQLLDNDGVGEFGGQQFKPQYTEPTGILFNGRFKAIKNNSKDFEKYKESQAIEIECEWNNDSTIPISYCYNCYFLHPLRAKHCYEIGFCVARYDHYCKLIENAVGANNLRFVIMHLLLDSVVFVWQLCMAVYIIITNIDNRSSNVVGWILIVFLAGYLLISSLTRTIHLFDHIQTISKNQTISEKVDPQRTIEVLNDGYHDYDDDDREIDYHDRYFDEGFFKNWFLCFMGYKENKEYFQGIRCKLTFDDDDGDDGTLFLQ